MAPIPKRCIKLGMIAALGILSESALKAEKISQMRVTMGTLLQIECESRESGIAEKAVSAAFEEVARLDEILSNYKETSLISRINREASQQAVPVNEDILQLLLEANRISDKTGGAFDVTIEPLTNLWKLREGKAISFPSQEDIETARAKTNYKNMEISTSPASVRFLKEGTGIDSGGIGKGYALDKALAIMRMFPIQSATLNFGGGILYWSQEAQKKTVGIRDPLRQQTMRETWALLISTSATAISTSANYERSVALPDSKPKWGHLLDPRTGHPVENEVRSVTIISENATEADALSTAIFVLGLKEGIRLVETQNLNGLILYEKNGKLQSYTSGHWKKLAKKVGTVAK